MPETPKKSNAEERRQYLRMEASGLSLIYERIPVENLDRARQEVLNRLPGQEDLEIETDKFWRTADLGERMNEQFTQLSRLLNQIDAKLDHLIAISEGEKTTFMGRHAVSLLDISGAGLSFFTGETISERSLLKLEIQFSRFPAVEILAIGRVIWGRETGSGAPEKKFEIGVQFEVIRDDDRERVFRFISKIERKMLRDRKEARTV